ncbi:MAG: FkbM family methyltransferase, partial [Candidatus Aquicultor sp.]
MTSVDPSFSEVERKDAASSYVVNRNDVAIIVPTRNSARTLRACLESIRGQRQPCTVIVVDNGSTDDTRSIAVELADIVLAIGPERSAQRNAGAAATEAKVIGFIDSDMVVDPDVVTQALEQMAFGVEAVVVPEHTIGSGFVARIREFERAQYVGASKVEAARFFTHSAFDAVGGFDESLNAGEDWDLSLRIMELGVKVGHVDACIQHDEARVSFLAHCAKKGRYGTGLWLFLAKHGDEGRKLVMDRPYVHRPWTLLRHPILGAGLILLKSGEAVSVLAAMARPAVKRVWRRTKGQSIRDSRLPPQVDSARLRVAPRIAIEKIAFGRQVIRTCSSWPGVLVAWLVIRVPILRAVAPSSLELHTRNGVVLRAPNSRLSAWPMFEVLVGDAYCLDRLPWRDSSETDLSVLDIGAHVGSFTAAVAQRFPNARFNCYEPSPQTASYLRENVQLSKLDQRVRVHQAAVASTSGTLNLYTNG